MSRTKEQAKKDIRKCVRERDHYVKVVDQLEIDLYRYSYFYDEGLTQEDLKEYWQGILAAMKWQVEFRDKVIDGLVDEIGGCDD